MPSVAISRAFKITPGHDPDFDAASAHMVARLRAATVRPAPFAHALVGEFLPAPLFAALRDSFPSADDGMRSVHARRGGDPIYSELRFAQALEPPNSPASEILAAPVRRVQRLLCSDRIVGSLLAMFETTCAGVLTAAARESGTPTVALSVSVELVYDRSGFELVPHTDGGRKLVTGLIYVAEPDDPEDLGTTLYEAVDPRIVSDGAAGVPRAKVRPVAQAPYRPNLLLCFGRTDRSFHGVEATTSDRPRRLVQFSIMLA
jgi:hypothetical protein